MNYIFSDNIPQILVDRTLCCSPFFFKMLPPLFFLASTFCHINNILQLSMYHCKKFGNFLAQNLTLPGTLAFYRIVNISNDQQMSLIITLP